MIAQRSTAERVRGRRQQRAAVHLAVDNPAISAGLAEVKYSPTLGLWAAVGNPSGGQSTIITSPGQGSAWVQRAAPVNVNLRDLVWTGQQFIATGDESPALSGEPSILKSADAITWTRVAVGAVNIGTLNGVASDGAGNLLAVGVTNGVAGAAFMRSDDHGNTWAVTGPASPGAALRTVLFDGQLWVAVGEKTAAAKTLVFTSPDRAAFTDRSANTPSGGTNGCRRAHFNSGRIVGIGEDVPGIGAFIITSDDHGVTWSGPWPNSAASQGLAVWWTGRHWLAVAFTGNVTPSTLPYGLILSSRDGQIWTPARFNARRLVGISSRPGGETIAVGGGDGAGGILNPVVRTRTL